MRQKRVKSELTAIELIEKPSTPSHFMSLISTNCCGIGLGGPPFCIIITEDDTMCAIVTVCSVENIAPTALRVKLSVYIPGVKSL